MRLFGIRRIYLILFIAFSIRTVGNFNIMKWPFIFIFIITYSLLFKLGQEFARHKREKKLKIQ